MPQRRFPILEALTAPHDVASLSPDALERLAAEMREAIIATVSETGGHLGASLGTVELTIALHCELTSPRDGILWDVGHQAYGHKLLTGRLPEFGTLRQHGGMSGFLRREESEHDVMGAGHASTSVSYGVGLAEAHRRSGYDGRVACVIGDGAMTGGMAYEGLNQAGALGTPMVVILNDNGMSISENVGALAWMFQKARVDSTITRVREEMERGLARLPGAEAFGTHLRDATKALWFEHGALFEALGFAYVGPFDGHDVGVMRRAIRSALERDRPVLIHAKTVKGKGYDPAENDVEHMHGATPFDPSCGKARRPSAPAPPTYTEVFGRALVREAEADERVIAITAAMLKGTGTNHMKDRFPERTYDVGIAEQHGAVFAAGMAIAGLKPVCAIYSTFLQRAFDPIVHDIALQDLNVVFAIDRGGLVGDDGPTHHGVFDLAYLRAVPNLTIMAPKDEAELVHMLHTALTLDGPVAMRYPRGAGPGVPLPHVAQVLEVGRGEILSRGERVALVGYGHGVSVAKDAAADVARLTGSAPTVVNARFCKPLDSALLHSLADGHDLIVTIEDHASLAGFGGAVLECLQDTDVCVRTVGLPDRFIDHGKRDLLLAEAGVTPAAVVDIVADVLGIDRDGELSKASPHGASAPRP